MRRSLAAAEQLSKAGYGQLAWINGGFDAAQPSDLPVKGAPDLRFGGIGGLAEILGWTDVQKQTSKSEGFLGGGFTIIKFVSTDSYKLELASYELELASAEADWQNLDAGNWHCGPGWTALCL